LRLVKVGNDAIPEVRPAAEELARLAAKAISREELTLADTSRIPKYTSPNERSQCARPTIAAGSSEIAT